MQKISLAALLLIIFSALCVARPSLVGSESEAPFSFEKGYVVVQAKFKGNVPVDVVLSTGSEHPVFNMGLLEKYKLPSYYAGEPPVTGTNDRLYSFTMVTDVSVGDAKAGSLNMRLGSMSELGQLLGREIFCVLGMDFFRGRVVQFDFKNQVVRFLAQSPANALKSKPSAGETIALPMAEGGSALNNYLTMPAVEKITFNGKEAKVLLDTGRATVVALSASTARKLGYTPPPEKSGPRVDKIDSLHLGSYEIKDVPVALYTKGPDASQVFADYGAIIGSGFLQNFIVTFDFRGKVVILEHL